MTYFTCSFGREVSKGIRSDLKENTLSLALMSSTWWSQCAFYFPWVPMGVSGDTEAEKHTANSSEGCRAFL